MTAHEQQYMTPERLVGIGFRGWLSGYQYEDIACWEKVWNTYAVALGPRAAKGALSELSAWIREVRCLACRKIEIYPPGCKYFCRDEHLAMSLIAACQHDRCPALRACAFALLGTSKIDVMLYEARNFAEQLASCNQLMSPSAICNNAEITASIPFNRSRY